MLFIYGYERQQNQGQKNTRQLLAISITLRMWWCNMECIAQWSTLWASLEATGCRHWGSACATSPWLWPWLTILVANTKTLPKHNF